MPSNHLILCHPLLLPPSVFLGIRFFSNESVLLIRWPKYWSFSFSIKSFQCIFRIDFLQDGLVGSPCSPRDSQESSPIPQFKSINFSVLSFLYSPFIIPYDYTVEVRNRFKELDLIERVPKELWIEVRDIVQETGIKTIPKKKKCKKAKQLSEEALQTAVKRREAKSKVEKERYTHLNTQFQRIARRDKKAFLSDQYKEIEENNRMGNTRDLFKKIRDTKGTFQAKMGTIKDRNGMDLTEAKDIKKRWQEYTEQLYKKRSS